MRFTKACALAVSSAVVANAADEGLSSVLDIFSSDLITDITFYKGLLLNMQRDAGNTETDCMSGFDSYLTLYTDLNTELLSDVEYFAGLKDKGQGEGSAIGF